MFCDDEIAEKGIACEPVYKVREGRPDAIDLIKNGEIQLLLNTPLGKKAQYEWTGRAC